jgi:hypothetical protein
MSCGNIRREVNDMRKLTITALAILLSMFSLVSPERANALGLELEGRWWPTSVSGSAGLEDLDIEIPSDIDVTNLLNLEADDVFEVRGTFRAFLGFYIRAAYQQMNHSGSLNLGDELDLPIDISSSINSGVDFDYARLALGWRFVFPEKIFSIGVFAEAKGFSGDAFISVDTPFFEDSASESFEAAVPSVGGVVEIWPVDKFQLYGEASFEVGYDDGNMMDAELAARYYPVKVLGLGLGYRIITIDAVIDNVVLDVDSKGFFLSGVLTF